MASLVVGADFPPLRLHVMKTILAPRASNALGCMDRDCLLRSCEGNKVQISGEGVFIHVVHHKNDRKERNQQPLSFKVPNGNLLDLLMVHIERGRQALDSSYACLMQGEVSPYLFVSNQGKTFSDSTFVHYWDSLMSNAKQFGFERFPPTYARTIFIEDFTLTGEASLMEGASMVMGNSVRQWEATYNPSRKRRLVENSVAGHQMFIRKSELKKKQDD